MWIDIFFELSFQLEMSEMLLDVIGGMLAGTMETKFATSFCRFPEVGKTKSFLLGPQLQHGGDISLSQSDTERVNTS